MQRLLSLDVFRGLTIASMILVNNPGSWAAVYPPLRHAEWNGWTFTDMVFPFFLWISGVAMTLSFSRRRSEGFDRPKLLLHAGRRAAIIFAIGMMFNIVPAFDFAHVRIPGVLQRIAICYFCATLIYLYTSRRGQYIAAAALLTVYTALMLFAPFPGALPDRWSIDANFARHVDGIVLDGHMYRATKYWDPEGVLSTLPAIATVLCGILARNYLVSGLLLFGAGILTSIVIPINKNLWTPSYVLFMAGMASMVYGVLYELIDVRQHRRGWKFFEIYGTNALVSYILAGALARILSMTHVGELTTTEYLYRNVFQAIASPVNASLLYAIANVLAVFSVAYLLYRKRILVRL